MEESDGAARFSIDKAYSYLNTSERPVYTVDDIADELGVSDTTVRNNLDELEALDGVESIEIGRTTAYYVETGERSVAATVPTTRSPNWENRKAALMAAARGSWKRQQEVATDYKQENPLAARKYLHKCLSYYVRALDDTAASIDYHHLVLERYDEAPNPSRSAFDASEWPLSEETIRYYLTEVEYYPTMRPGPVKGFAFFHNEAPGRQLADEYGHFDPEEVSDEELDEVVPSFGDILEAGAIWDNFVCEMFDWRW